MTVARDLRLALECQMLSPTTQADERAEKEGNDVRRDFGHEGGEAVVEV